MYSKENQIQGSFLFINIAPTIKKMSFSMNLHESNSQIYHMQKDPLVKVYNHES